MLTSTETIGVLPGFWDPVLGFGRYDNPSIIKGIFPGLFVGDSSYPPAYILLANFCNAVFKDETSASPSGMRVVEKIKRSA